MFFLEYQKKAIHGRVPFPAEIELALPEIRLSSKIQRTMKPAAISSGRHQQARKISLCCQLHERGDTRPWWVTEHPIPHPWQWIGLSGEPWQQGVVLARGPVQRECIFLIQLLEKVLRCTAIMLSLSLIVRYVCHGFFAFAASTDAFRIGSRSVLLSTGIAAAAPPDFCGTNGTGFTGMG